MLSRYLVPFTYYNLILLLLFSLSVELVESFQFINSVAYILFHYVIIYLGLYYYRNILYVIYFLYGLGIDLLLINQIGTHLPVFMVLLVFFRQTKKYFRILDSKKIYLAIFLIQIITIFIEMMITFWFFGYSFDLYLYLKYILISLLISYPIFFIFIRIDSQN